MFYIGWGLWEKCKNNFLNFFKKGGGENEGESMERQQIMGTNFLFSKFVSWFKMFYIGWGLWEKCKNNFSKFF